MRLAPRISSALNNRSRILMTDSGSLTIYPGLFDTEISNEVEDTRSVVIGDEADTTLQGIIRLTGLSTGSAVDVSGEEVIRRTK